LRADICAQCCGTEREVAYDCPFDCEHLLAAREHDKLPPIDPEQVPNREIRVSDEFLMEQEALVVSAGRILFIAAAETPGVIDNDVREAIAALIKTFKTLQSGLVYETRPPNPLAAAIQVRFQAEMQQLREDVARQTGVHSIRDNDVLGVLAFWQRVEYERNNGRRRGRAFLHSLMGLLPPAPAPEEPRLEL
jgi:hypothetical protein